MSKNKDQDFLSLAAQEAHHGIIKGDGGPFGAVIAKKGMILAVGHNTVLLTNDPTCHAEINAIRWASRELGTPFLNGFTIYTTTEPCPMCFAAIHWARIKTVFYGTTIQDVKKLGFNELSISAKSLKKMGKLSVKLTQLKNSSCENLLETWKHLAKRKTY